MGKPKARDLQDLSHLAQNGAKITVRVTPKAARNAVLVQGEQVKITVTAVPEGGKATAEEQALLARSIGVPASALRLIRGATTRDKTFVLDMD